MSDLRVMKAKFFIGETFARVLGIAYPFLLIEIIGLIKNHILNSFEIAKFDILIWGVFILFLLFRLYYDKMCSELNTYIIYDDGVEINKQFVYKNHVFILFKDIKGLHVEQSIIQRKYNIATIWFETSATNVRKAISFKNIDNYNEIYKQLKQKIMD